MEQRKFTNDGKPLDASSSSTTVPIDPALQSAQRNVTQPFASELMMRALVAPHLLATATGDRVAAAPFYPADKSQVMAQHGTVPTSSAGTTSHDYQKVNTTGSSSFTQPDNRLHSATDAPLPVVGATTTKHDVSDTHRVPTSSFPNNTAYIPPLPQPSLSSSSHTALSHVDSAVIPPAPQAVPVSHSDSSQSNLPLAAAGVAGAAATGAALYSASGSSPAKDTTSTSTYIAPTGPTSEHRPLINSSGGAYSSTTTSGSNNFAPSNNWTNNNTSTSAVPTHTAPTSTFTDTTYGAGAPASAFSVMPTTATTGSTSTSTFTAPSTSQNASTFTALPSTHTHTGPSAASAFAAVPAAAAYTSSSGALPTTSSTTSSTFAEPTKTFTDSTYAAPSTFSGGVPTTSRTDYGADRLDNVAAPQHAKIEPEYFPKQDVGIVNPLGGTRDTTWTDNRAPIADTTWTDNRAPIADTTTRKTTTTTTTTTDTTDKPVEESASSALKGALATAVAFTAVKAVEAKNAILGTVHGAEVKVENAVEPHLPLNTKPIEQAERKKHHLDTLPQKEQEHREYIEHELGAKPAPSMGEKISEKVHHAASSVKHAIVGAVSTSVKATQDKVTGRQHIPIDTHVIEQAERKKHHLDPLSDEEERHRIEVEALREVTFKQRMEEASRVAEKAFITAAAHLSIVADKVEHVVVDAAHKFQDTIHHASASSAPAAAAPIDTTNASTVTGTTPTALPVPITGASTTATTTYTTVSPSVDAMTNQAPPQPRAHQNFADALAPIVDNSAKTSTHTVDTTPVQPLQQPYQQPLQQPLLQQPYQQPFQQPLQQQPALDTIGVQQEQERLRVLNLEQQRQAHA